MTKLTWWEVSGMFKDKYPYALLESHINNTEYNIWDWPSLQGTLYLLNYLDYNNHLASGIICYCETLDRAKQLAQAHYLLLQQNDKQTQMDT